MFVACFAAFFVYVYTVPSVVTEIPLGERERFITGWAKTVVVIDHDASSMVSCVPQSGLMPPFSFRPVAHSHALPVSIDG